uniref:Mitofilin n=1 Tax=Mucochytrium quahogii TaxID=96639 RepID=A0A7S2SN68_9STRA|mmetsp:Transcript_6688/g.10541  ORF Transcript_6688/g.10541 Transcript_6688/m.10541 type:complete len:622 (+) Transcript_6688:182-2047(+)
MFVSLTIRQAQRRAVAAGVRVDKRGLAKKANRGQANRNVAKPAPQAATPAAAVAPAQESTQAGGSVGKLLILAGVVATPAYVAYALRTDPAFRSSLKENIPWMYNALAPYVVDENVISSSLIDGVDVSVIKKELAELERRYETAAGHETTFSKNEVQKLMNKVKEMKEKTATDEKKEAGGENDAAVVKKAATAKQEKAAAVEKVAAAVEEEKPEQAAVEEQAEQNRIQLKPKKPSTTREKVESVRESARSIKKQADRDTEDQIKEIEKSLRKDLEVVLAHDLTSLDEEGLRRRVVQLALELKDRNRWEALRLHELTKQHTEDLVKKYDNLLREQADQYEELVRYETEQAASRASEEIKKQADEHYSKVLYNKEQQWQRAQLESLERQRNEMGQEMEHRFNAAKQKLESQAAEELKSRSDVLSSMKAKVQGLQSALAGRSKNEQAAKQLRSISLATLDLQDALYRHPETLARELTQLKKAGESDVVVNAAVDSLPSRVYKEGVTTELQLVRRFESVYDSCYRVALVPEDGGVLEHAVGYVVASLTFRHDEDKKDSNAQEAALARARVLLLEQNDLKGAVAEMDKLRGSVKDTASDWLSQAKDRVALEQVVTVVKGHLASMGK